MAAADDLRARVMPRPGITIVNLWSARFSCQRCGADTLHAAPWPYYEEFLHPEAPNPEGGHVPVCGNCLLWLNANICRLWRREVINAPI